FVPRPRPRKLSNVEDEERRTRTRTIHDSTSTSLTGRNCAGCRLYTSRMNTLRSAVRSLAMFLAMLGAMARGEEATLPGETQLRATVAKGLAFLDQQADTWMDEKTCNGCHHMPELIWSHREAQRRGFAVDRKMFDEFVDWSGMHAKDT